MKRSLSFLSSLVLSLLLCGSALAAELVNINTADAAALDAAMVNVGPAKAQAIVEYRRENGAFKSVEELALVKGIGLRTIELNRDRLTIGNGKATQPVRPKPAAAAPAPARR